MWCWYHSYCKDFIIRGQSLSESSGNDPIILGFLHWAGYRAIAFANGYQSPLSNLKHMACMDYLEFKFYSWENPSLSAQFFRSHMDIRMQWLGLHPDKRRLKPHLVGYLCCPVWIYKGAFGIGINPCGFLAKEVKISLYLQRKQKILGTDLRLQIWPSQCLIFGLKQNSCLTRLVMPEIGWDD